MSRHIKRAALAGQQEEADAKIRNTVETIIADVAKRGDAAVREMSERFDKWSPPSFRLAEEEVAALALRGAAKAMLVTDAMPPVGGTSKSFRLYGQPITACGGRCATPDGTLAGSVLDMASAVRNCVRMLDLPLTEALPLATTVPAAFLGIDGWLGHLASGYRADMVAIDPDTVDVFATWVAGMSSVTVWQTPGCGEILLGQRGHLLGDHAARNTEPEQ